MEFWNDLGKTVNRVADKTVKETGKLAESMKLKYRLNGIRNQIDFYYRSLGELSYTEKKGKTIENDDYQPLIDTIDDLLEQKKKVEKAIADAREDQTCPECGYRIKKGLAFCPKCGARLNIRDQND